MSIVHISTLAAACNTNRISRPAAASLITSSVLEELGIISQDNASSSVDHAKILLGRKH